MDSNSFFLTPCSVVWRTGDMFLSSLLSVVYLYLDGPCPSRVSSWKGSIVSHAQSGQRSFSLPWGWCLYLLLFATFDAVCKFCHMSHVWSHVSCVKRAEWGSVWRGIGTVPEQMLFQPGHFCPVIYRAQHLCERKKGFLISVSFFSSSLRNRIVRNNSIKLSDADFDPPRMYIVQIWVVAVDG